MTGIQSGLAVLVLGVPLLLCAVIAYGMITTRYGKQLLVPEDPAQCPKEMAAAGQCGAWAEANDFEWAEAHRCRTMGNAFLATWKHRGQPTYLTAYVSPMGTCVVDLTTILNGRCELTTGNNPSGTFIPCPPGNYRQVFPKVGLDEQWRRHLETLVYLTENHGVEIRSDFESLAEAIETSARGEAKHVMSFAAWPLRVLVWYFTRRALLTNRSVRQLIEMGQSM